ncbi:MAG: prolipoprotein diacylglyceryl transferase [Synergistaceae bacterium]|nr:prolipoprotein diacylglyceryl transferase [Synergistaceae bacterium]
MYPTLFQIFGFRIDTYSVIWFTALSFAIIWVLKRLKIYDIDENEARNVMSVSFLFMLLGARMPEYIENWKIYSADPILIIKNLNAGGIHEIGAVSGALISAMLLCLLKRKKISFLKLAEAASVCALLAIAVGRWGCFMNGCCVGEISDFCLAVHFPNDEIGITRHPVQIYYSVFAFVSILILLCIEKLISRSHDISKSHSILAPLSLILFTVMRFVIIPVRDGKTFIEGFNHYEGYSVLLWALPFEILWLLYGLRRLKSVKIL